MYSFLMITFNPGFAHVRGGMQFVTILQFGIFVVGLFTAIFLFYANSFLIKRRKKELGLYSILGMEKRHVARVLFHELALNWAGSMVIGLAMGVLLSRLLFLLIRLAIRINVPLVGSVSLPAIWGTLILFATLYLLLIGYNTWQVRSVSPIDLLHGGQTGEREPKAHWILAIAGILCMGGGYAIAQTVKNPMAAIALFFVAVILVILGTYLLFLTGSIVLLKLLKRNKRYYYQSQHFVTVSGMLYRMKQNAAGLASIAILCTMAMITIGTTVALYNGSEKMLTEYYPSDMQLTMDDATSQAAAVHRNADIAAQTGVMVRDLYAFHGYELVAAIDGEHYISSDLVHYESINDYGKLHDILMLTEDQYALFTDTPLGLTAGEIAMCTTAETTPAALQIGETYYNVLSQPTLPVTPCLSHGTAINKTFLIVPDDATAKAILTASGIAQDEQTLLYTTQWNISGDAANLSAYYTLVNDHTPEWTNHNMRVKAELREEWYSMHGGFLFVVSSWD